MSTPTTTSTFLHLVYFFPREAAEPEDAANLMLGCRKNLSKIPGILRLEVGLPAGTDRSVVDNSYAVALFVEFVNAAACHAYDTHPDHQTFIAENSKYWSRVQVYDTITVPA